MHVDEQLWQTLLQLKNTPLPREKTRALAMNSNRFSFSTETNFSQDKNDAWDVIASESPFDVPGFQHAIELPNQIYFSFRKGICQALGMCYRHYLPLLLPRIFQWPETFVLVHAAQSLDGKVCTLNGASQWIGNQDNLTHAHRIRALVDAVLVGANTMRNEHPKLSVRHVAGDNPIRIVFCNSVAGFTDEDLNNTWVICREAACQQISQRDNLTSSTKTIKVTEQDEGLCTRQALKALRQAGINSLMVEGGGTTINLLLQNRCVNWLQLHVAPMLFGSGKSIYHNESITAVNQALQLQQPFYAPMGNAMMVTGHPK